MASRIDYSQNRKLYVGTTAEISVPLGAAIIDNQLIIGGSTSSLMLDVASDAIIGSINASTSTINYENKLIVAGKNNYSDGTTWYGGYGQILLSANSNMTGSARQFLITNALDNTKFAIIRSVDASTVPVTDSTASGLNSGTADFVIDNTGRIGIGTDSPEAKLEVRTDSGSAVSNSYFRVTAGAQGAYGGTAHFEGAYNDYGNVAQPNIVGKIDMSSEVVTATDVGGTMKFFTKATGGTYATAPIERMRIDSNGNVGIGVIPEVGGNTWQHIQFGGTGNIIARKADTGLGAMFANNYYINSSNVDSAIQTGEAARVFMSAGDIRFDNAQSVSANAQVTFNTRMKILSNGFVGIGDTNPGVKLDVASGTIRIKGDQPAGAYYYGFMYDGTNLQGTTQTNLIYTEGTVLANTTIAEWASLRIGNPSTSATGAVITNNYAIKQDSSAQKNYFAGNIGVGTTTPFEKIDVDGNIYAQNRIISADVSLSNKNLLPEASIKFAGQNDIYSNSTKTTISPYEARWVNTSGTTAIRASTATLVNGEVYTVSIYYKDLIGSLTMDLGDTAIFGSYSSATGTSSVPTSGRIYGRCIRNSNNYEFIDVNLSNLGEVTLLNIKLEQGNVVTEFIATPSTQAVPQTITTNNIITTGSVGIGTTDPGAKLEVAGGSGAIGGTGLTYLNNSDDAFSLVINNAGTSAQNDRGVFDARVGSSSVFRINNSGNVSIGATSPNGKLSFENAVETRKIVLYEAYNNDYQFYGIGIEANTLLYTTANDTDDHVFFSGATDTTRKELMRIEGGGNVGIGTTSPDAQLEISNNNATSGAGGATLRLTRADGTSVAGDPVGTIEFYSTDADTPKTTAYIKSMSEELYGREGSLAFGVSQTINADATEAMRIDSNANVGIGTTSPQVRLTLRREDAGSLFELNRPASAVEALYGGIVGNDPYFYSNNGIFTLGINNPDGGLGGEVSYITMRNGATRYTTFEAGNVGIGTTTPGYKLDVVGTIRVGNASTSIFTATNALPLQLSRGLDVDTYGTNGCSLGIGSIKAGVYKDGVRISGNLSSNGTDGGFSIENLGSGVYTTTFGINSVGGVKFNSYNSTNQTGTPTYMLGTDASGNVVKTNTGNTPVGSNIYTLPSTAGSNAWKLLGRFTAGHGGQSVFIKMVYNSGYNASIGQNLEAYIRFKTSNGGSVDGNGFSGDSSFYTIGASGALPGGYVKWVSNAAGTAATSYDLYVQMGAYSGNGGFYTVENTVGTWTPLNNAATDPGAASSTILQSTKQFKVGASDLVVGADGADSYFANSNVGIGTTNPYGKLDVAGDIRLQSDNNIHFGGTGSIPYWIAGVDNTTNNNFLIGGVSYYSGDRDILLTPVNNGNVGIKNTAPSYTLDVTGTIRATGDVIAYSDARVKDNVITIDNALDKVTKLRGVSYTRNDVEDKTTKIGVIAQEVLEVIPEVVQQDDEGKYSVAYGNMVGLLIESIKELKAEVDELKSRL